MGNRARGTWSIFHHFPRTLVGSWVGSGSVGISGAHIRWQHLRYFIPIVPKCHPIFFIIGTYEDPLYKFPFLPKYCPPLSNSINYLSIYLFNRRSLTGSASPVMRPEDRAGEGENRQQGRGPLHNIPFIHRTKRASTESLLWLEVGNKGRDRKRYR